MTGKSLPPGLLSNYSHSFFPNGFRRPLADRQEDTLPDLVAFENGQCGLVIDVADLTHVKFGRFESNELSYVDCLDLANRGRMQALVQEALIINVIVDSKAYRVISCDAAARAARGEETPFNSAVRLWEAGKIVQRFEFMGLRLEDDTLTVLNGTFSLEVVVWPDSIVFTLNLAPPQGEAWSSTSISMQLKDWSVMKDIGGDWSDQSKSISLTCNMNIDHRGSIREEISIIVSLEENPVQVNYSDKFNCYFASLPPTNRKFATGYTDIRDYDDFLVKVTNSSSETVYAPFIQFISVPANVTGMAPIVCSTDGVPTGIPIQISKNWHYPALRDYAYFFTFLPVQAGSNVEYIIRVAYGFYGDIPSASHAQLSLIGYSIYTGRWEQLAVGCFGETFCIDPETSIAVATITDVRGLMLRNGSEARKWGWTTCGNGGDWLMAFHIGSGRQFWINSLKTAYMSHGPCLTDVRYQGSYGDARQIEFTVRVRTVRTDDYSRTFLSMTYAVNDTVSFGKNGYFHMVRCHGFYTRDIAVGHGRGMLFEKKDVPENLEQGEIFIPDTMLEGSGPWWVSYPQNEIWYPTTMGVGTKHFVIRSFEAKIDTRCYNKPTLSFHNYQEVTKQKAPIKRKSCLDCLIRPPEGVTKLNRGDSVSLEVMWMTTATVAENYYGPNQQLRSFLNIKPKSWEIVFREVNYNYNNGVIVEGGEMESKYPLKVLVTSDTVNIAIKGGLGGYPMEFYGLTHINYALFQIVNEAETPLEQTEKNDFWQTDFDTVHGKYTMIFTPVLGRLYETNWRFRASV